MFLRVQHLKVSPRNVRRSGPGEVSELAASIASVNLIAPLKVLELSEPQGKITHEIVAGSRRLAAIKYAIKHGMLPRTFDIRCELITEDEAREISLAENIMRQGMHYADEYEAFKAMADDGSSIEDIAQKFGVTENVVKRRLKLANVAPEIMKAFRAGKIDHRTVAAYALSDDQERQLQIFKDLGIDRNCD